MRIMTLGQMINELNALAKDDKNMYAAQVNVTIDVASVRMHANTSYAATFDGPAEVIEKVFLPEGPAIRICSRNGAKVND